MKIPFYQVDAFTAEIFSGNPAAVCLLEDWLEDTKLQAIAEENNLSETAFLVPNANGFDLRWFTPAVEVALCGHATLASAYVLFNCLDWSEPSIHFQTRKSGELIVTRKEGMLEMDFPARLPSPRAIPDGLVQALGIQPQAVLGSQEDLLVILENIDAVRKLSPDFSRLVKVDCRGVIVTAAGVDCDFVSRFFAPRVGVAEDPVTGSAHCVLVPYWADRLSRQTLHARQISKRGGELFCKNRGARVLLAGMAALYLEGNITLS